MSERENRKERKGWRQRWKKGELLNKIDNFYRGRKFNKNDKAFVEKVLDEIDQDHADRQNQTST